MDRDQHGEPDANAQPHFRLRTVTVYDADAKRLADGQALIDDGAGPDGDTLAIQFLDTGAARRRELLPVPAKPVPDAITDAHSLTVTNPPGTVSGCPPDQHVFWAERGAAPETVPFGPGCAIRFGFATNDGRYDLTVHDRHGNTVAAGHVTVERTEHPIAFGPSYTVTVTDLATDRGRGRVGGPAG